MAELFGMHSEEALARFAVHDFALPVSEADGMRHFIYDLSTLHQPNMPCLVDECRAELSSRPEAIDYAWDTA
jgi:hypothetical protein